MSYWALDYPAVPCGPSLMIHAVLGRVDPDLTSCPGCGTENPDGFAFANCNQPECEYLGCNECLNPCDVKTHAARRFCPGHLHNIGVEGLERFLMACPQCEREPLEVADEDE